MYYLIAAKRIIERHGGHIEAKANLPNDCGCVFRLFLPISFKASETSVSQSAIAKSQESHSNIELTQSYRDNRTLRCLIVDDAPVVRKMIGRVVQDLFASIAYAANGEEATQLVSRSLSSAQTDDKFDIIFMDRCMPVKDGIEATRTIRDMGYRGVILGVTGDALAEDVETFLQAGADKVVTKPIRADHFIQLIEGILCFCDA